MMLTVTEQGNAVLAGEVIPMFLNRSSIALLAKVQMIRFTRLVPKFQPKLVNECRGA
jgi:hypothetical protein